MSVQKGLNYILDIGNYSLKLLKVDCTRRPPCVVGMHIIPLKFDIVGSLAHKDTRARVAEGIKQLFAHEPKQARRNVTVILPDSTLFTRFVTLPNINKAKLSQIIRFEVEQQIPFIIDEVTWAYEIVSLPQNYDLSILISAIRNSEIEFLQTIFHDLHIRVNTFTVNHIGYVNLLKYCGYRTENTLLVDLGDAVTSLVLTTENKSWGRNLLNGSGKLTSALSEKLSVDFKTAEKLKRAMEIIVDPEENQKRKAGMNEANRLAVDITEEYVDGLLSDINRSMTFYFSLSKQMNVHKILLTGGGAHLKGIAAAFQQRFDIQTEILDLGNALTAAPAIEQKFLHEKQYCFASIGAVIAPFVRAPLEINLLPEQEKNKRALSNVRVGFFTFAIIFIGVVALLSAALLLNNARTQRTIDALSEKASFYTQCVRHESQIEHGLARYAARFSELSRTAAQQDILLHMFDTIATHIPDSMWLTAFTYKNNGAVQLSGLSRGTLNDITYVTQAFEREQLFKHVTVKKADIISGTEAKGTALRSFTITLLVDYTAALDAT